MRNDAVLALAGLLFATLSLMSCVSRPEPRVQAALGRSAWFEEQVEEGFGRLDQLPRNRAALRR